MNEIVGFRDENGADGHHTTLPNDSDLQPTQNLPFGSADYVSRVLFQNRLIPLSRMRLHGEEMKFLARVNDQLENKIPLIPLSNIDANRRTMWNTALTQSFPLIKFQSLKGSVVRGKATKQVKHSRYAAYLQHYHLEFHCILLEESNQAVDLASGIYIYKIRIQPVAEIGTVQTKPDSAIASPASVSVSTTASHASSSSESPPGAIFSQLQQRQVSKAPPNTTLGNSAVINKPFGTAGIFNSKVNGKPTGSERTSTARVLTDSAPNSSIPATGSIGVESTEDGLLLLLDVMNRLPG